MGFKLNVKGHLYSSLLRCQKWTKKIIIKVAYTEAFLFNLFKIIIDVKHF